MITILTAAYGDDVLQDQPEQSVECRWVAVSDERLRHGPTMWDVRVERRPHLSPRMAAKIPKYLPSLYVPKDGALVMWMDCSVKLTSPHSVDRLTSMTKEFGGIGMIPHPDRNRVEDEWPEAARQGRYKDQMVREQVEWYRQNPMFWDDHSLWATTIIVQRIQTDHHVMGMKWLVQNCIWSAQDQISLPWTAANSFVHIWPITVPLWNNDYFTLREREKDV